MILSRSSKKGDIDAIVFAIFAGFFVMLTVITPLLVGELTGSVQTTITVETEIRQAKYESHMMMSGILQNKSFMKKVSLYTINPDDDRLQNEVSSHIAHFMSTESRVPYGNSESLSNYQFKIDGTDVDISEGRQQGYSTVYIGSPSREPQKITVGLGEH